MREPIIVGKSLLAVTNRVKRRGLYKQAGGKCFYCGDPVINPGIPLPRDWLFVRPHLSAMVREHRIPTSRGGEHVKGNFACSCARCNNAKGPFTADEYRLIKGFRTGSLNFRFAAESACSAPRDWLITHSPAFEEVIVVRNMPSAKDGYELRRRASWPHLTKPRVRPIAP